MCISIWLIFLIITTSWALSLHFMPSQNFTFIKYLLRLQTCTWAHFILNFRPGLPGGSSYMHIITKKALRFSYSHTRERQSTVLPQHLDPLDSVASTTGPPTASEVKLLKSSCACGVFNSVLFSQQICKKNVVPRRGSPIPRGWDTGGGKKCWPLSQHQKEIEKQ